MPSRVPDQAIVVSDGGDPEHEVLLDRVSDGYYALDRDWRFAYLSPQCEKIFRQPASELLGTIVWDAFPGSSDTPTYTHFHRAVAEGVALSFELYWPPHDAWFAISAYPSAESLSVFVRDITAEQATREQLRFQAGLLDAVEQSVIATDQAGNIIYWNRHAEAQFGWPAGEVIGRPILAVVIPEEARASAEAIMPALLHGESWSGEFLAQCRDGSTFWAHGANSLLFDRHGKVSGMISVSMDISDQRASQDAVKAAEARHRTLIQHIPAVTYTEPLGVATGTVTTMYLSPQIEQITGYPYACWETIPNFGDTIVHPDDRERRLRHIKETDVTGEPYDIEYRIIHRNGHIVWLHNQAVQVHDDDGTPLYWQGFITDITERKRSAEALRHSEARLQSLMRNASDTICVLDRDGRIVYQSSSIEHLTGFTPEEIVGGTAADLLHPDDLSMLGVRMAEVMATPGVHPPVIYRARHKDGTWRTIEAIPTNLLDDPSVEGIVLNCRDVTERQLAEAVLRESEERFRALVQNGSDLITIIDRDGTIRFESPSIEHMLGYGVDDLIGANAFDLIHPDDAERVVAALTSVHVDRHLREPVAFRFCHADGTWRWLESTGRIVDGAGGIHGAVINSRDVTERIALEEQLEYQALHDDLTGLPNRTLLLDRLDQCVARAHRHHESIAVLFIDLDDFKLVNDSLGHAAGDEVLVLAARRLHHAVREGDTVARFGGDEFVIILGHPVEADDAIVVANRIAIALAEPFVVDGRELPVAASIGIALATGEWANRDDLVRHADIALYRAKTKGKNTYDVFDETMHEAILHRIQLEADLRRAIERNEFVLHYQPTVSLKSGTIVGVEALVRWQHPERGLVSPAEFIPIAEETGLILPLGAWILRAACRQGAHWLAQSGDGARFSLSVNLSSRQFAEPGLVEQIADVLTESGFPAERLALEITESDAMGDAEATIHRLRALKALGIHLAVDDFGTGYSSLAYLKHFPVDVLKIDRSFIDGLGNDDADTAIVAAIVGMAQALGLRVVAEGVETTEQLAHLRDLNCDGAQGFLFSRPLPAGHLDLTVDGGAWVNACPSEVGLPFAASRSVRRVQNPGEAAG
jgi:diguanylate cyclase (GGDEF)-like protein/PAS domain S-box-containing protein